MSSSSVDLAERRFFGTAADAADGIGLDIAQRSAPALRARAGSVESASITGAGGRRVEGPEARPALAKAAAGLALLRNAGGGMLGLELARGTPFSFVPVFLAIGALGYFTAPIEPSLSILAGCAAVASLAVFAARRRVGWHLAMAALLCIVLGSLFAKLETVTAGTKMLGAEITTRLTGRIVVIDHLASGRVRLILDVVSTQRPKLRYAPDRVRITARAIPAGMLAGDEITGVVRLMPPLGATQPGGYDFAFESYFDRVGATGFFLGAPKPAETAGSPSLESRFLAAVENARDLLAARIRAQIGGAEGEIAAALIAGVRAGIPEEVNEALRRTGLAHVLSISGLHMALVAATIMSATRLGFACFPLFASRHPVRKYSALVALVALAAYLFISGNQVAAQRSFLMIAIMLVALLFDYAALTMRNLALAAIVVLVVSPHEVVGPSFQMSFAATAALIGGYATWTQRDGGARRPAWRDPPVLRFARLLLIYVLGLAATSVLAGAATTIFGAYHFQRVSPLSLFANLAAMPVVSVLVMPFAVLGLLAMPLGLEALPLAVMGEGLRLMVAIAAWFSERSPLDAIGLISPASVICFTVALVLATLLTTWLRLAALPFLLAGTALLFFPPKPRIFISEDGRLAAIRTEGGRLAVNRSRPNDFALDNWTRAATGNGTLRPIMVEQAVLQTALAAGEPKSRPPESHGKPETASPSLGKRSDFDGKSPAPRSDEIISMAAAEETSSAPPGAVNVTIPADGAKSKTLSTRTKRSPAADDKTRIGAFRCSDMACVAETAAGPVVTTSEADLARSLCDRAALIVLNDATAEKVCDTSATRTVTRRDLARQGSAMVLAEGQIVFSVREPYRPWHDHRRFSREARGLAPWKPDASKARAGKKPANE